jgi:hypothetical protein
VVPAIQEVEVGESQFGNSLDKVSRRPYLKCKLKSKRTGGKAQVVEHLHNKHKALSSVPSTEKKKSMRTDQESPANLHPDLVVYILLHLFYHSLFLMYIGMLLERQFSSGSFEIS